ncbi:hypothetical protein Tco_0225082, partial [Tanacetum coccineum]
CGGLWCGGSEGDDGDVGREVWRWEMIVVVAGDDSSGVVIVVAKVAAGWWRPRWCGDCEGSGGEVVMVASAVWWLPPAVTGTSRKKWGGGEGVAASEAVRDSLERLNG